MANRVREIERKETQEIRREPTMKAAWNMTLNDIGSDQQGNHK